MPGSGAAGTRRGDRAELGSEWRQGRLPAQETLLGQGGGSRQGSAACKDPGTWLKC